MKRIVFIVAFSLWAFSSVAQSLHQLQVVPQDNIKLPWGVKNLTLVNGRLYGCCNGVMVSAATSSSGMFALQPDTLPHFVGESFDYVVRNPRNKHLYFTRNKDGKYTLMEHVKNRGRKNETVDLRTWHKGVFHPTFSPDGNLMVFTSSSKVGLGGYDLWCSFWNGKHWSRPVNMGNAINGSGNEINPVFYGDYLIFASDSVQNSASGYSFYSVRLHAVTKIEDILFSAYKVQRLPYPINSDSNDFEMAVDPTSDRGYWLTNRSGNVELYAYEGSLRMVMLTGVVSDDKQRPVSGAEVKALENGRVVNTAITDTCGRYRLLVQPGGYQLRVSCQNYFTNQLSIQAVRSSEDYLVVDDKHDVTLAYLPFNRTLIFDHIYRRGADVEISDDGKSALLPVADFVRDNSNVQMHISLVCDQTVDEEFNDMIIERRISDLRNFLLSVLPDDGQILIKNGNEKGENEAKGTGRNAVLVTLYNNINN